MAVSGDCKMDEDSLVLKHESLARPTIIVDKKFCNKKLFYKQQQGVEWKNSLDVQTSSSVADFEEQFHNSVKKCFADLGKEISPILVQGEIDNNLIIEDLISEVTLNGKLFFLILSKQEKLYLVNSEEALEKFPLQIASCLKAKFS